MASQPATNETRAGTDGLAIDWDAELARHDRWLRTAVWARLRDAEAVNDVMQEVALAVVRQTAPLADARRVAPWLHQVAVRQALMYRRRLGRRKRLGQSTALDDGTVADPNRGEALGWLLAEERREMVRRALGELGARDAEVLLLKYTENWSYQQIAEHLGIGHSAVESRLHRARKRMRERLARYEAVEAKALS